MSRAEASLELVERCAGTGVLEAGDMSMRGVRYRIDRYQGIAASGLPIPGLHRIEGSVELGAPGDLSGLVGSDFTLRLEDGRALRVTLADADGRVLSVGHGPSHCGCC